MPVRAAPGLSKLASARAAFRFCLRPCQCAAAPGFSKLASARTAFRFSPPFACLEEIAYRHGWIDRAQIEQSAAAMGRSNYVEYLRLLLNSKHR